MTCRTLGLLMTLAVSLVVAALAAEAQPTGKVAHLGILTAGNPPSDAARQQSPFWQTLRELG
jgi:hypothetical protein